jgi:hypothetical protein
VREILVAIQTSIGKFYIQLSTNKLDCVELFVICNYPNKLRRFT